MKIDFFWVLAWAVDDLETGLKLFSADIQGMFIVKLAELLDSIWLTCFLPFLLMKKEFIKKKKITKQLLTEDKQSSPNKGTKPQANEQNHKKMT